MLAGGETLNDIRFAGWGEKEWADNEYIRAVRKTIAEKSKMNTLMNTNNTFKVSLLLRIFSLT